MYKNITKARRNQLCDEIKYLDLSNAFISNWNKIRKYKTYNRDIWSDKSGIHKKFQMS